jgi:hypothetical protein
MPGIVPDARTASSGIEADSHSPEALFQAEQRGDELLLTAATGSRGGAAEAWRLTRASDVWSFIDDNPLVVQDRRDDGLRWIDKHGYIHRQPAGTRSRLPLAQS